MSTFVQDYDSPLGTLLLMASDQALVGLHVVGGRYVPAPTDAWQAERTAVLSETVAQLDAYFAGHLREFRLPLAPQGTAFQRTVWDQLLRIPYAATQSYGAEATALGRPSAVRAVAAANGRNPIAIVIPCHRVIGSDGKLVGYGGGLRNKAWLLAHEDRHAAKAKSRRWQDGTGAPSQAALGF